MRENQLFIPLCLFFLLFGGCRKDEPVIHETPETKHTSDIFGVVTHYYQAPVEGALVSFNGKTTLTDKNGIYLFNDVEVSSRHNMIQISKEEFITDYKVFAAGQRSVIFQESYLSGGIPKRELNTSSGGKIKGSNFVIDFPGSAFIFDNGEVYTGWAFNVNYDFIDIGQYNFSYSHSVPGAFIGLDVMNRSMKLNPYGIIFFDLRMPGGPKLNLGNGKQAALTLEIPAALLDKAPQTVPIWRFDPKDGYWKEWGSAQRSGNEYTGNVNRTGYWMFSTGEPAMVLSGKMVDYKGTAVSCPSQIVNEADFWPSGPGSFTNCDGSFSIWIAKNVPFKIKLWPVFLNQREDLDGGPYSTDFNLGEINVRTVLSTAVSGKVTDCDNNPLQRGYLIRKSNFNIPEKFIPVINGIFNDYVASNVIGTTYTYTAVDLDVRTEGVPKTFTISQLMEIVTLSSCQ